MRTIAVVVAILSIIAGTAGAQPCFDLATSHTDGRDLTALRTEIEATCGCESAESGRAYRSCAKTAFKAALLSGSVRLECKRDAKRLVLRTTCGTTKATCGLVRTSTNALRGCKVRPADRCRTSAATVGSVCEATHCADVEQWTAGTCVDPRAPGPYAAGVREMIMTKDSVVSPGTPRDLPVYVWYPALPGQGPIDGATKGVLDAAPDPSGGPYPLILFSHGSCGWALQSTFLTPLLASHGFVVAAMSHPGNTLFEFPTCGTAQAQVASFAERPADVIHVLDQLVAATNSPGGAFTGLIDETRVGMMGHSFGGLTTYLVANQEPRIIAAAPLAPFSNNAPPLGVPSLTMIGDIDSVVSNAATVQRFADSVAPKQLVSIAHAGHYAFSNACFPSADCDPPTTLTQTEAHDAVLRWVLPFFEVHLAGDASFQPLLADPAPPGVTVETVP